MSASGTQTSAASVDRIRLGVAYYAEQIPEAEWETDAALMADLGLDTVRVGEFCWSRMQRPDGALTLDWLECCIETFARRGVETLLCTPTATPPVWACERFPDLPLVTPDGRVGAFGGRRHYSPFHHGYRELSVGIAAALAERFGAHEAVVGWQLDNEAGSYSVVDCSPPALAAFHRHVASEFESVDELNRRWNLAFWNQEVERFDQIPAPTEMMTTRNPQMLLCYNRFCLRGWAEYLLLQARAVREHAAPRQFITTNCEEAVSHTLFALQDEAGEHPVDTGSVDNYPELLPEPGRNAFRLDRHRAFRPGRPFFAPEMQLGSGATTTGGLVHAPRRYWAFETLARGARMLSWFQWLRFSGGCEWRLSSVLERDRVPRGPYESLRAVVAEIRRVEPLLREARVAPDVQIHLSLDNAVARDRSSEAVFWMEIQLPDGVHHRMPLWEKETLRAVYLPLVHRGRTVAPVTDRDAWDPTLPLIVPDLDICDDGDVERLRAFCESGGLVALFPGAGERDPDGRHRDAPPPGLFSELTGATLFDYHRLDAGSGATFDPAAGRMTASAGDGPDTDVALDMDGTRIIADGRHAEALVADDADVLAVYSAGDMAGRPAVTRRAVGSGSIVYLGAVPRDETEAGTLWTRLLPDLPERPAPWRAVALDGPAGRLRFHLNDTADVADLGRTVHDEITDATLDALPPFGVALTRDDEERPS